MSESRVTWATSVPILVFVGLSVLDLGPMYATDVRRHHRFMPPPISAAATICPAPASGDSHPERPGDSDIEPSLLQARRSGTLPDSIRDPALNSSSFRQLYTQDGLVQPLLSTLSAV